IYTEAGPVPFSEYGYRVTLFVPGFNGSSQIVRVDADSWNPSVELSVTPARPLALRLVDQSLDPWIERELTLVPLGDGRPILAGRTDNFGTVVFEAALAGDYEVRMGDGQVQTITVEPPGFIRDDLDRRFPSQTLVVPHGRRLTIEVFGLSGYALEGA